ncbi:uncharacterized protein LOC134230270 [Saccostrea cucullata]|uniref:uncharacterized protein LOC134230270 n=1 Tax=Saccostrea cuccullata TaxID=36930 RepID=UPI002ED1B795
MDRIGNLVLPFSFSKNLLSYFFSGSRSVCTLNSVAGPAASYRTLLSWIEDQACDPVAVDEKADTITYFDNNQILARSWRVNYDNKAILSAITTIVHFFPNTPTFLQENHHLSPRKWLYSQSFNTLSSNLLSYLERFSDFFRYLRSSFIESRLQIILKQQKEGLTGATDFIQEAISRRKRVKEDEDTRSKSRIRYDPYDFVPHNHHGKPTIVMGNPVTTNPCSYDAVKEVLTNIKDSTTGGCRRWTVIGCDGLPYLIASRVIREHSDLQDILLQPGLGHFEMNMTKAIIKLIWNVVGEDLAKMLGYRSPKALQACMDANDHHKAFQFLEILLFGTGDELLLPYVRQCLSTDGTPSAQGYFEWCCRVQDPNYKFLQEVIFTYTLSVYLFRAGVRRNNCEVIMAARLKFAPLYFGTNKYNYQQIEVLDSLMRVCAPAEVSKFINDNESLTQSGHPSKGEGCDFILESRNKMTKKWLPPGAPKEKHWNQACRNLDKLEKVLHAGVVALIDAAGDLRLLHLRGEGEEVKDIEKDVEGCGEG